MMSKEKESESLGDVFIVTAYRYGDKESHSYVVGAFNNKEEAIKQSNIEREWRGGKYECEVKSMKLNETLKYKNYEVVYVTQGGFSNARIS